MIYANDPNRERQLSDGQILQLLADQLPGNDDEYTRNFSKVARLLSKYPDVITEAALRCWYGKIDFELDDFALFYAILQGEAEDGLRPEGEFAEDRIFLATQRITPPGLPAYVYASDKFRLAANICLELQDELGDGWGLSVRQLAQWAGVGETSATKMLQKLRRCGFVDLLSTGSRVTKRGSTFRISDDFRRR